jgi:hypothetical protein
MKIPEYHLVSIVKTENVSDFPRILRQPADDLEKDISIQKERSNAAGQSFTPDGLCFEFDYQIEPVECNTSLYSWIMSFNPKL